MTPRQWIDELRKNAKIMRNEAYASEVCDGDQIDKASYFDSIADHIEAIDKWNAHLLAEMTKIANVLGPTSPNRGCDGCEIEMSDAAEIAMSAITVEESGP